MNFHLITIFPEFLKEYLNSSILGRAQKSKKIKVKFYNPRDYAKDKHRTVDGRPFGGGPGMVMMVESIAKVLNKIKSAKSKVLIMSPAGKQFNQKMARDWAKKYNNIVIISGHYEGIDARVKKIFKAEEISVGPYVLTGGELPSGIVVDAVSRHILGVLGKGESLEDERGIGIPAYTRPEVFEYKKKKYRVPKVLMSGHHKNINEWRKKHAK